MKKYHNWRGFLTIVSALLFLSIWPLMAFYSYGKNETDGGDSFLITGVLFLIILLIFTPVLFIRFKKKVDAKNAYLTLPEQNAPATVLNKSEKVVGDKYSTGTVFYITFEMPDGERKNFQVIHDKYATIEKDDVGTLIYKEGNGFLFFVDFKRKPNKDQ
ncbi:MAG: hypothetical protein BGN88_09280 [Clostridiales bacterium 43-6]|nr:MAG: hypothetical protein BGN88_09280 [Clostridiales bacterium 43-6]